MSGWPSCLQHVKLLLFGGYQNYIVRCGKVLLFVTLVYVQRVPGLSWMNSGRIMILTLLTSTLWMSWSYTSAPSPRANTGMSWGDSCLYLCRMRLKCDGTSAETRFRLCAKRTSPFISAGASVQSTTGSRGVHISCSNAGYTMFRGSV